MNNKILTREMKMEGNAAFSGKTEAEMTVKKENITTHHLVRKEDLNHHDTLFAGRIAEWIVETGYITAAAFLQSSSIVCANVHDIQFFRPVKNGETVRLDGTIIRTGHSSLTAYVFMTVNSHRAAEGTIVFVHVDEQGKPKNYSLLTEEEAELG